MFGLEKVFGSYNSRIIKGYERIVREINSYDERLSKLSDDELRHKTTEFKEILRDGKTLDDILPEAFAVVREAAVRTVEMRHFDVQLMGGIALHKGCIAEMKTGEGKTLVATLAVYLNALTGKGVHVVTVNDYLAKRDAGWMGRIYRFLDLSVGVIVGSMWDGAKRDAYNADITYGTNHEFGFDYLRDNLKFDKAEMVMRPFNFAVVDEVDSILIDEARTPLIISGVDEGSIQLYSAVDSVVKTIANADEFDKDEKSRVVTLTDIGVEKVEKGLKALGLLDEDTTLYDHHNISLVYHVNCALKAHRLFTKNVDYIVKDGQVLIIDEFTGRIMDGRRYSEGLHQAIEAKEHVEVKTESQTIATISYQNLFRLYPKLSGMTGTAMTEEAEFDEIYKLKVVSIPSNKPVIRVDHEDSIFLTLEEKDKAVVNLIKECIARNQPVLVGTTNIDRSEYVSHLLTKEKIK
ncbi:MAG: preprotein translocase subunit SecA, partial [Holosporales bacterium]|nr:preprotein translocase subunit SecA [Holosporales bacterium]